MSERPESEPYEFSENEVRLRNNAAARLGRRIEQQYSARAARDICIEGRSLGLDGHTTCGVIRTLRIGGRLDFCGFVETDSTTGKPMSFEFFYIDEDGSVTDQLDTLTLAKAAAIADGEESVAVSHERYYALKDELPQVELYGQESL